MSHATLRCRFATKCWKRRMSDHFVRQVRQVVQVAHNARHSLTNDIPMSSQRRARPATDNIGICAHSYCSCCIFRTENINHEPFTKHPRSSARNLSYQRKVFEHLKCGDLLSLSFYSYFESGNFAAHLQMVRSLRARIHMSGFTRLSENFIIQLLFRCTSREASAITRLHFSGPVHLTHARPKHLKSITNSALSHSHDCFRSQPRLLGRSLVKIHLDQRRQHIPR